MTIMPNVGDLVRWESGEMEPEEVGPFFQGMIDSGLVWQLQGSYGRAAVALIEAGICEAPPGVTVGRKSRSTACCTHAEWLEARGSRSTSASRASTSRA